MARTAELKRKTTETDIFIKLNLDAQVKVTLIQDLNLLIICLFYYQNTLELI